MNTLDPQEIRRLARKWALLVIIFAAVGAAVSYGVSSSLTPTYESDGSVLVLSALQQGGGQGNPLLPTTTTEVTSTYAVLMTANPLLQQVGKELDLPETPEQLAAHITVTPQRDTQILQVAVRDPSPERATQIANQLINDFLANRNREQGTVNPVASDLATLQKSIQDDLDGAQQQLNTLKAGSKGDTTDLTNRIKVDQTQLNVITTIQSKLDTTLTQTQPRVALVSPARLPTSPASPRMLLNTALAGLAGLLIGLGLAVLVEYFDQGLRSEEDVRRRLGMSTLGVVPVFSVSAGSQGRSGRRNQHAAEAYRRLRTNLTFCSVDKPVRSVVITSARQGEGKTSTSANLARIIAASGQRVLLADADMRHPSQHLLFHKPLVNGMSELLLGAAHGVWASVNGEHHTDFRNLTLITAGVIPPNPAELLASKQATQVMHQLAEQNDLVVIDTPPVGAVTDALGLAAVADATVVVVKAGSSARHVLKTVESLRNVGATVVGVVLNKAKERRAAYYYYGVYYEDAPGAGRPAGKAGGRSRGKRKAPPYSEEAATSWTPIARPEPERVPAAQSPPPPPRNEA